MAGGETGAIILNVLVQNLIELSKDEISLIRGVKKEAQKLTGNLDSIQKFLNDAGTRADTGEAVNNWLKKLENVAFDADNVLDELSYHLLSREINKTMKPIKKEKLLMCFSPLIHIARKRSVAVRIKEINMELESINKTATELGLQRILADAPPSVPNAGMESDAITKEPIFIGRDDVVSEIVEMLTLNDDERVFSIIPIVGMGGLGKTTLTRGVFNHPKIEAQFGSRIWVHVSQTFDANIIFKKIVNELTSQSDPVDSRQEILKKLQQALKDKTYLLVLDDVWNEDATKWEDLMNALSGVTSTKGNGIVVTTRKKDVASIVRPFHVHHLDRLSEQDCWSIIKAFIFGKRDIPSEYEMIGRKISKRCQGLPLAAKVVGGILHNNSEDIDKWHSIEQKWLSDGDGDNITKILRLSFDNLISPSLKKCFAYCSIFPKGYRIVKDELIEMWMAEGFLLPDGSNDMEYVGDKFYNVLLHSSLLRVAKREWYDYENAERCVMHDLVHDLASSIIGFFNNEDGTSRVRYMRKEEAIISSPISKEVAKYLRTLFFEGASSINFSNFKCLHGFTLTSYQVTELPNSVRKLIHLRYLNISMTKIENLPGWIGELHHLQTLRAKCLWSLPSTLKYLINLRHLNIRNDLKLPAEIGKLTSLQTLEKFTVGDDIGYKIEELGSLDNLKGELEICYLEKVKDNEESGKANLFKKSKLFELHLSWDADGEAGEVNDENVLEGLQPHSNLKMLWICGYRSKRFPLWTMKMAVRNVHQGSWVGLHNLTEIRLYFCEECEEIPMMGHLPNLKSLTLDCLVNLHTIKSSVYGIDMGTRIAFPMLETLTLNGLQKLIEWEELSSTSEEVKVFPRLKYLEIGGCEGLMNAPTHFSLCLSTLNIQGVRGDLPLIYMSKSRSLTKLVIGDLDELECLPDLLFFNNQNLTELKIWKCPKLSEMPDGLHSLNCLKVLSVKDCPDLKWIQNPSGGRKLPKSMSLTKLSIEKLNELECLPDWLFYNNQNMLELEISKCPKLRELPDGVHSLNYLEKLMVEDCPNLKWIRNLSGEGSLTSLRSLQIRECGELMELPYEIVESCLPSLQILSLVGVRSIKNIPKVLNCLTKANRLRELKIVETPELQSNSCVEIQCYFEKTIAWPILEIGVSTVWLRESGVSIHVIVDAMLQRYGDDAELCLVLRGMEVWRCLQESLQHLTALSRLAIENFEEEDLPEWFGNLSSLKRLDLSNCSKLRRLPSPDTMQRLSSLLSLEIRDCPELCIESKCLDMSHLNIKVDGHHV